MKNVERGKNLPVEIIEERLKVLRTHEIDALIAAQTPEIKGVGGGKTTATWKGKSTNSFEEKSTG